MALPMVAAIAGASAAAAASDTDNTGEKTYAEKYASIICH